MIVVINLSREVPATSSGAKDGTDSQRITWSRTADVGTVRRCASSNSRTVSRMWAGDTQHSRTIPHMLWLCGGIAAYRLRVGPQVLTKPRQLVAGEGRWPGVSKFIAGRQAAGINQRSTWLYLSRSRELLPWCMVGKRTYSACSSLQPVDYISVQFHSCGKNSCNQK